MCERLVRGRYVYSVYYCPDNNWFYIETYGDMENACIPYSVAKRITKGNKYRKHWLNMVPAIYVFDDYEFMCSMIDQKNETTNQILYLFMKYKFHEIRECQSFSLYQLHRIYKFIEYLAYGFEKDIEYWKREEMNASFNLWAICQDTPSFAGLSDNDIKSIEKIDEDLFSTLASATFIFWNNCRTKHDINECLMDRYKPELFNLIDSTVNYALAMKEGIPCYDFRGLYLYLVNNRQKEEARLKSNDVIDDSQESSISASRPDGSKNSTDNIFCKSFNELWDEFKAGKSEFVYSGDEHREEYFVTFQKASTFYVCIPCYINVEDAVKKDDDQLENLFSYFLDMHRLSPAKMNRVPHMLHNHKVFFKYGITMGLTMDINHNGTEGVLRYEYQLHAEESVADQFLRGNNPAKHMFADD